MRGLRGLLLGLAILTLILVGGVVAVFLIQNDHWVALRFPAVQLEWGAPFVSNEFETPLYVVMLAAALLGAVLATLAYLPLWLRRTVELHRDRRFIDVLEDELTGLRNLPVTDPAPLEDIDEEPGGRATSGKRRAASSSGGGGDEDEATLMAVLQGAPQSAARPAREGRR